MAARNESGTSWFWIAMLGAGLYLLLHHAHQPTTAGGAASAPGQAPQGGQSTTAPAATTPAAPHWPAKARLTGQRNALGQPIVEYARSVWGNPPANYQDIVSAEQAEIADLQRRGYAVTFPPSDVREVLGSSTGWKSQMPE